VPRPQIRFRLVSGEKGDRAFVQNDFTDGGQFDQFHAFQVVRCVGRSQKRPARRSSVSPNRFKPHGAKVTGVEKMSMMPTADRVIPGSGFTVGLCTKSHTAPKNPR